MSKCVTTPANLERLQGARNMRASAARYRRSGLQEGLGIAAFNAGILAALWRPRFGWAFAILPYVWHLWVRGLPRRLAAVGVGAILLKWAVTRFYVPLSCAWVVIDFAAAAWLIKQSAAKKLRWARELRERANAHERPDPEREEGFATRQERRAAQLRDFLAEQAQLFDAFRGMMAAGEARLAPE
jgi:hypothetical protein